LITDVDPDTGMVKAKVPESVLVENSKSGKEEGESRDYTNYPRETVYSFSVSHSAMPLPMKGDVVKFSRRPVGEEDAYNNTLELEKVLTKKGSRGILK
jgi:hypothetical protein